MKGLTGLLAGLGLVAAVVAGASPSATTSFGGRNGRIVFNDQSGRLVLVNPDGTGLVPLARTGLSDYAVGASFSPDGARIAYSADGRGDPDVYVIRTDGSGKREITFSRGADMDPAWSRDGTRIAFESYRGGNLDLYAVDDDGTHTVRLTSDPGNDQDPAWSPTADRIAYTVRSPDETSRQIWMMNGDGSGKNS